MWSSQESTQLSAIGSICHHEPDMKDPSGIGCPAPAEERDRPEAAIPVYPELALRPVHMLAGGPHDDPRLRSGRQVPHHASHLLLTVDPVAFPRTGEAASRRASGRAGETRGILGVLPLPGRPKRHYRHEYRKDSASYPQRGTLIQPGRPLARPPRAGEHPQRRNDNRAPADHPPHQPPRPSARRLNVATKLPKDTSDGTREGNPDHTAPACRPLACRADCVGPRCRWLRHRKHMSSVAKHRSDRAWTSYSDSSDI
jgi:hypothetical protein